MPRTGKPPSFLVLAINVNWAIYVHNRAHETNSITSHLKDEAKCLAFMHPKSHDWDLNPISADLKHHSLIESCVLVSTAAQFFSQTHKYFKYLLNVYFSVSS